VFIAIHMSGRWCVLSAIVPLRSHSYEPGICHEFGCPGVHLHKFPEFLEHFRLRSARCTRGFHP